MRFPLFLSGWPEGHRREKKGEITRNRKKNCFREEQKGEKERKGSRRGRRGRKLPLFNWMIQLNNYKTGKARVSGQEKGWGWRTRTGDALRNSDDFGERNDEASRNEFLVSAVVFRVVRRAGGQFAQNGGKGGG
ncbi:hypothetical protein AVEN_109663-1 [Araneus ventricosus]|uniref:Uncharacterized protein n=1 Tax=Araneus ventricosus TaxID=182803 RepID=A0A4Y2FX61_ARAVE|nr:hypothetical protein AVEN_109663-1 [Araneus ventricosus]